MYLSVQIPSACNDPNLTNSTKYSKGGKRMCKHKLAYMRFFIHSHITKRRAKSQSH